MTTAMLSTATENYLKTIYLRQQETDGGMVSMGTLAESLNVVPGTATAMVKKLAEAKLVDYEPYAGVQLTQAGQRAALGVLRRHRLIESFLVAVLGFDWSEVHDEAEQLEHTISDKMLDRIDAVLGRPSVDPHGDPIPDADGNLRIDQTRNLVECESGENLRLARVLDQDEEFLRYLDHHGLRPGVEICIEQTSRVADAITLRAITAEKSVTLGATAASRLLVEPTDSNTES